MTPRIILAAALFLFANMLASAGVIVHHEKAPEADSVVCSLDFDGQPNFPGVQQANADSSSLAFASINCSPVMPAISSKGAPELALGILAQRLRLWNSSLPATPFLDHLLKPS